LITVVLSISFLAKVKVLFKTERLVEVANN